MSRASVQRPGQASRLRSLGRRQPRRRAGGHATCSLRPVTCQPSPRSAACTTITTKAATDIAEAMPEVMLLAISSPRVYSLLTTERAPDAVIGPNHFQAPSVLSHAASRGRISA